MESVPFTLEFDTRIGSIITDCQVSEAYDVAVTPMLKHPSFHSFKAIWDTGAMHSSISTRVVRRLGISPFSYVRVSHADGESMQPLHTVNMLLPNKVEVKSLLVTEAKMTDIDVLIGMDVIALCDFALTSAEGKTKFSFQIPGSLDIDFTK